MKKTLKDEMHALYQMRPKLFDELFVTIARFENEEGLVGETFEETVKRTYIHEGRKDMLATVRSWLV